MKRIAFIIACTLFILIVFVQGLQCSKTKDETQQRGERSTVHPATQVQSGYPSESSPSEVEQVDEQSENLSDKVQVCKSKSSYAYHARVCSGLKKCKAGTTTLTKEQAQKSGYRPCKICY